VYCVSVIGNLELPPVLNDIRYQTEEVRMTDCPPIRAWFGAKTSVDVHSNLPLLRASQFELTLVRIEEEGIRI
jgi:hypothetical protein